MKRLFILGIVLCFYLTCIAQNELERINKVSDSLAVVSRNKADAILAHFDTLRSPKLLYSLDDRYYYLIIKDTLLYKEYYITTDSLGKINKTSIIKNKIKNRKQRKQEKQYQELLSKTNPFDLSSYHTKYITKMPDANYIEGKPTYFVVKDIAGNRYGEYRLPALTLPSIIDVNLYIYLFRRVTESLE